MTAFTPDPNSRASKLVDHITANMTREHDTITYPEIVDITGIDTPPNDPTTRATISNLIDHVNHRLDLEGHWQHLVSTSNIGYRVGSVADQRAEMSSRLNRAIGQQRRAIRVTTKTRNHPNITDHDRVMATNAAAAMGETLQAMRRAARSTRGKWPAPETSPVNNT